MMTLPSTQPLSLPFDELRVGDSFLSQVRTITEQDVMSFAQLTGDYHPQHTDFEFAARSNFGERIAHGMLVLSFAVGLVAFDPAFVAALRGLDDARFKRPVAIGDSIRVSGEFTQLTPVDDELGLARCLWNVLNQDARCCVRASVGVLWRRAALVPAVPVY